jgi:predicted metal-dependent enzyme (double-stranded beta helix superfamily)
MMSQGTVGVVKSVTAGSALHAATGELVRAAEDPAPLERVRHVLGAIIDRFHALGTLVHEEEDDELLLHASVSLTIYHITLSPGLQYPPHNHLMDALIGIYRGSEANLVYPVDGARIGAPERLALIAPALLHMPPDIVHSVANPGPSRSGALHVYLGDLVRTDRQMWSAEGGRAGRFDNDRYLAGARRVQQSVSERGNI